MNTIQKSRMHEEHVKRIKSFFHLFMESAGDHLAVMSTDIKVLFFVALMQSEFFIG